MNAFKDRWKRRYFLRALLKLKVFYEREILKDFDQGLSERLDAVQFLIDSIRDRNGNQTH